MHFMDPESLKEMRKAAGFQVELEAEMAAPGGGREKFTGRLQLMEERTPPPGIYAVPEGYAKQGPAPKK
jgi:hypothetical protein